MQSDRFTIKSQEAIAAAGRLAEQRRNPQVTPEHLLATLLGQDGGIVPAVLRKLGVEAAQVRAPLSAALDGLPTMGQRPRTKTGTDHAPAQKLHALETPGHAPTRGAADGKPDPVIGRDEEL